MKLEPKDLEMLCQVAVTAAQEAGTMVASYSNGDFEVTQKQGSIDRSESQAANILTEVDLKSQKIILQGLQAVSKEYDLGLLSEETPDDGSRLQKDYFWSIDPLDGTLCFVQSSEGFAVSIALVTRDGTPVIGVVCDPSTQALYHAINGQGAFCNGQPLTLDRPASHLSFHHDASLLEHKWYAATIEQLEAIAQKLGYDGLDIHHRGEAVMNGCWTLESAHGCYFKYPRKGEGGGCLWDYAAIAGLFEEAGAAVSDIDGKPLELNRQQSLYLNHRGVLFATNNRLATEIGQLYRELSS